MPQSEMLFRRQFLLTPADEAVATLERWPSATLRRHRIYAHPDVELTLTEGAATQCRAAMIGYAIAPDHPDRSNADILAELLKASPQGQPEEIARGLHALAGRFALIVETPQDTMLFHDAGGFRSICYTRRDGRFYAGSQPLVMGLATPLAPGPRHELYENSAYRASDLEHWIPSGATLYEQVHRLSPNHYLSVASDRPRRYWPTEPIRPREIGPVADAAGDMLTRLATAGESRMPLALAMTAGWDSRLLLAACRTIAQQVYCFTLVYRQLQSSSRDIRIPRQLLGSLGLTHHLIDCCVEADHEFRRLYEQNVSMPHWHDWGMIAAGLRLGYPADRVSLRGGASEICRCSLHNKVAPGDRSLDAVLSLMPGWRELPFATEQVCQWYAEAAPVAEEFNLDLLDLYYWEQRMGSWQSQSQLEWDLVQETYSPYAHRGLIELMLGVPASFRREPSYLLQRRIGQTLWPEVMKYPINPPENLRQWVKGIAAKLGVGSLVRKAWRRLH